MTHSSISLYRGQARHGIGEGQGGSSPGEQFLAADPPLRHQPAILASVAPWLTLDATTEDHRRLGKNLVAFSLLEVADYQMAACLRADGDFFGRPAYFAHGRFFAKSSLEPSCDGGVLLGLPKAFDDSWRDRERPATTALPPLDRLDTAVVSEVNADRAAAAGWLAALATARQRARPLVVLAPLEAFASGGTAARLAAFARAALPRRLGLTCKTRIFSRNPRHFLELGAHFLVVPEDLAPELERGSGGFLRLDFRGRPLGGAWIDGGLAEVASEVVKRFCNAPEGLLPFSARLDRLERSQTPLEAQLVPLVYNLACARSQKGQEAAFFEGYLLGEADRLGESIPWPDVLDSEDWDHFPPDALAALAAKAENTLSAGRQCLQAALLLDRGARLLGKNLAKHDVPLEIDRRRGTEQLIAAGAWLDWRQRNRDQPSSIRRFAAICWLTSPRWREEGTKALRSEWLVALEDLGRIDDNDLRQLLSAGRPIWPWLPPFELDQVEELVKIATTPAIVAALRQAARRDGIEALPATTASETIAPACPARGASASPEASPRPWLARLNPGEPWRIRVALAILLAVLWLAGDQEVQRLRLENEDYTGLLDLPPQLPRPRDHEALDNVPPRFFSSVDYFLDELAGHSDPKVKPIYERNFRPLESLDPLGASQDPRFSAGLAELGALAIGRDGLQAAVLLQVDSFLPFYGQEEDRDRARWRRAWLLIELEREWLRAAPRPPERSREGNP